MRHLPSLTLFAALLLFVGCREEGITTSTTTGSVPPPTVVQATVTTVAISGVTGEPVTNPTITGLPPGRRHPDGSVTIDASQLSTDGTRVTVTKEGFWPEHRVLMPAGGGEMRETFVMEPKVKAGEINPREGGLIQIGENFSVEMSANTIVTTENGDAYEGEVDVYVNHDAPEDAMEMLNSPGNYLARMDNGELAALESFGMMDISFETPNGEPLILDDDTPAEVRLPLKAATEAIAPDEAPFWVLDPAGFWLPNGTATLAPGCYVVFITTSSTCNIDIPHPVTRLCGRFMDVAGFPLTHSPFLVSLDGGMTCSAARVDCDGEFCVDVAAGVPLRLTVTDPCTDMDFIFNVSPIAENTLSNIGDIEVDLTNPAFVASVVDCDGSTTSSAEITEIWVGGNGGNGGEYFAPGADGETVLSVLDCSGDDLLVQAFTNDYTASSPVIRRDADDVTTQQFVVCGDLDADEYFTLTIGEVEVPITQLAPIYWPNNEDNDFDWLVRAAGELDGETYSLFLQFTQPAEGTYAASDAAGAVYRLTPGQDYTEGLVYVDPDQQLGLRGVSVAEEGTLFEGTFEATMNLQDQDAQRVEAVDVVVSATFRIRL